MTYKIIELSVNTEVFRSVQGRFHHVHTSGTLYLIGGAARNLLLSVIKGIEVAIPNDYDWTIVGKGESFKKDYRPKGNKRIEVEYGAPHQSLDAYFASRDFTINEVAVDSKGTIYTTERCVNAWRDGVIELSHDDAPTLREAVRAIRFAGENNFSIARNLLEAIKSQYRVDQLLYCDVCRRYREGGINMRKYIMKIP